MLEVQNLIKTFDGERQKRRSRGETSPNGSAPRVFAVNDVSFTVEPGELFTLLVRKTGRPVAGARAAVLGWHDAFPVADTSSAVLLDAKELAVGRRFALWDAIVLAAAAASRTPLATS